MRNSGETKYIYKADEGQQTRIVTDAVHGPVCPELIS